MAKVVLDHLHFEQAVANPRSAIGNYLRVLSELISSEENEVFTPEGVTDLRSISPKGKFTKALIRLSSWVRKHRNHQNLIAKSSPDLSIIFHSPFQFLSAISSRRTYTTLIYDAPSEELIAEFVKDSGLIRRIMRAYDGWTLRRVDKVVVYGSSMRRYAQTLMGGSTSTRFVIHQNVDFHRISENKLNVKAPKHPKSMVFSGSFLAWHGVPDFVAQLGQFDSLKSWEINICGEGPELEKTKLAAENLEGRLTVLFHGFVEADELMQILEKCQIGLMPSSNWYGAPAKIFEYLASDCFVFAPRTPTIQDVFGNAPGVFLFTPGRSGDFFGEFIDFVNTKSREGVSPAEWFYQNYSRELTRQVYLPDQKLE